MYLRNTIMGATDGLVSTVGLLAGINVTGVTRSFIILTGIIYIFVEAFSMGIGSFLSEESAEMGSNRKSLSVSVTGGVVMFTAFVIAAFIALVPYMIASGPIALWLSIFLSLATLFGASLLVRLVSKRISRRRLLQHATQMVLLGGCAILIGVAIGKYVHVG